MKNYYITFQLIIFTLSAAIAQQSSSDSSYYQIDSVFIRAGRNELPLYQFC